MEYREIAGRSSQSSLKKEEGMFQFTKKAVSISLKKGEGVTLKPRLFLAQLNCASVMSKWSWLF